MSVETLTPAAAAELIASTHVDIIDVRDEHEWVGGHLDGARSLPLDTLRADGPEPYIAKDATVLFVCAKGVRSLTAAQLAARFGYAHVYNLDGGTKQWTSAGYSLVSTARAAA